MKIQIRQIGTLNYLVFPVFNNKFIDTNGEWFRDLNDLFREIYDGSFADLVYDQNSFINIIPKK